MNDSIVSRLGGRDFEVIKAPCQYCDTSPCTQWCTRFGNYDPTVKLDKKPLDIAFEKLDNELVRRPLKTYSPASLLLDAFKETK